MVPSRLGVDTKCCVAFGLRKELTEQLHSLVTTQRNFRVLPSPSRRVRILIRVTILSHMCHDPISYVSRSCPIRVTILPQLCHDPASVVSRSCLSCVTILPQLCHDPASYVSRSCLSCVTSGIMPRSFVVALVSRYRLFRIMVSLNSYTAS